MLFRILAFAFASSPLYAAEVVVTINTHKITEGGIELIAAETSGNSFSTNKITTKGSQTWKWDLDTSKGDAYIYLNYFHGSADISVSLQGVIVFSGSCSADTKDNARLSDLSKAPIIWISKDAPSMPAAKDEPVSFLRFKPLAQVQQRSATA